MKLVFIKYLSLLVSLLILVFGDKSMNMVPIIRNEMRRTLSRHTSRSIGHNFQNKIWKRLAIIRRSMV
jgi:hypothetical protein